MAQQLVVESWWQMNVGDGCQGLARSERRMEERCLAETLDPATWTSWSLLACPLSLQNASYQAES